MLVLFPPASLHINTPILNALHFPLTTIFNLFTLNMATEPWQTIVSRKQIETASKIPAIWRLPEQPILSETSGINVLDVPRQSGLLSERQLEITEQYDASDLLYKIRRQELSAFEVTEAFCIRAAIAQQVVRLPLYHLSDALQMLTSPPHRLVASLRPSLSVLWNVLGSWMRYF